jgi:hypothetical protein
MTISNSAMEYGSGKQLEAGQRLDAILAAIVVDEPCGYPASATRDEFGLVSADRGRRWDTSMGYVDHRGDGVVAAPATLEPSVEKPISARIMSSRKAIPVAFMCTALSYIMCSESDRSEL